MHHWKYLVLERKNDIKFYCDVYDDADANYDNNNDGYPAYLIVIVILLSHIGYAKQFVNFFSNYGSVMAIMLTLDLYAISNTNYYLLMKYSCLFIF